MNLNVSSNSEFENFEDKLSMLNVVNCPKTLITITIQIEIREDLDS